jgi:hypothetical protein
VRPAPGEPRGNAWRGPGIALCVGLVATSTFWLKNWIWYGDPVYPSLYKHLTLRPWTVDAADLFEWGYKDFQFWRPTRDLGGVESTVKALYTFSFLPNDYSGHHGKVPVFGSLFTLLVACLPFLRRTKRVWALTAATLAAVAVWYWTHHQDRYLQTLVPWMTAATAATMVLLWQSGKLTRLALSALVGLQVVWAGDLPFLSTHTMSRSSMKRVIDLLASGYNRDYDKRFETMTHWVNMHNKLPRGARVLLHDNHTHLGLAAETVSDWGAWQFGISYGRHRTPREIYDLLKGMGVTHISWDRANSNGWDSVAGDIMFFEFAMRETVDRQNVDGAILAKMPTAPPSAPFDDRVAMLGCNNLYKSGVYKIQDLTVPVFGPKSGHYPPPRAEGTPDEILAQANILVLDERCHKPPTNFELAARRKVMRDGRGSRELTLWLRSNGNAQAAPAPPPLPLPSAREPEPGERPDEEH